MLTLIVVVFVLYLALMLGISWMGKKNASSFDNYLTTGGSSPLILLIGGAVGAQIGNGLVVGGAGSGAAVGIAGAGYGLGCAFCYVVLYFLSDKIRAGGWLSAAEYLQEKYGSVVVGQLCNLVYAITVFAGMGSQMMAARVLFEAMGLNGTIGVLALSAVVFLYSQISGIWGAYATSVAQITIIAIGILVGVVYLFATGAWSEIPTAVASGAVQPTFLSFKGYDLATWAFCFVPITMTAFIDGVSFQRIAAAKTAKDAKNHFLISALVIVPLCLAPVVIGMYGRVHFGVADNTAFFSVILNIFPPILAAIVVVAVIAAVMSTIDGILVSTSVIVIRGIYKNVINKNATDEQMQKLTLPLNLIAIGGSIYFALSATSIIDLLSTMNIVIGAVAIVPVALGWFWQGITTKGATAGMVVGTIYAVLQMFGIYELPMSGITYVLPSLITTVVVSLATRNSTVSKQ